MLRRLRYALQLTEQDLVAIYALVGESVRGDDLRAWTRREGEPGARECPPERLAQFLDGLIRQRRGPPPPGAAPAPVELTNNEVMKRVRIALNLREADMLALLAAGGQTMSSTELSALFRKPEHRHFRPCGDQALRKFLIGLTQRERRGKADRPPAEPPKPKRVKTTRRRLVPGVGDGS